MGTTENYLLVLSESLDKKIVILKELDRLTAEQKEIVDAPDFDEEAFNTNVQKKGALIEELEKLDNGFQILYNNVKAQIEGDKDKYKPQIADLQTKIKTIVDYTSSLQVAEKRNSTLIRNRFNELRKEVHQVRKSRDAATNYYRNMNNIDSATSVFMDQKK